MTTATSSSKATFIALRPFARKPAAERCELCGLALAHDHTHLFEHAEGRLLCACEACAILFYHRGETRYSRVPRDVRRLDDFQITDAEWSTLRLPIDMAFFQNNARAGRMVAYYPSPAGCTESLLDLDAWSDIARKNPLIADLDADVEALLVNRTQGRRDHYLAPIDKCYQLTGILRVNWQGLSGGEMVWQKIGEFFDSLEAHA